MSECEDESTYITKKKAEVSERVSRFEITSNSADPAARLLTYLS
jgi:hypothetical protein